MSPGSNSKKTQFRPKVLADGTNITQTRTFVYDGNQRVQSVTNPENGTTSYAYNADGTMNTKTDAKNQTLAYVYDSLGRLAQLSSAGTTLRTFTYDANGWGQNINGRVAGVDYGGGKWSELYSYHAAGTAPTIQQSYDMATNRLLGQGYDNNGNMTSMGTFDAENRLVNTRTDTYDYGIDNKRIYKSVTGTINTEEVYFYAGGRRVATYQTSYSSPDNNGNIPASLVQPVCNVYFGGKLIISGGQPVVTDRLGSVVARLQTAYNQTFETNSYFPYGEERTASTNNRDKFGTYFRDASTGLDYADQRFYESSIGRFLSVDPDSGSGNGSRPGSWNRYSYASNDPAKRSDRHGTDDCDPDDPENCFEPVYCWILGSAVYEQGI